MLCQIRHILTCTFLGEIHVVVILDEHILWRLTLVLANENYLQEIFRRGAKLLSHISKVLSTMDCLLVSTNIIRCC